MNDTFLQSWAYFDPDGEGFIKIQQFDQFMMMLGKPLGWELEEV